MILEFWVVPEIGTGLLERWCSSSHRDCNQFASKFHSALKYDFFLLFSFLPPFRNFFCVLSLPVEDMPCPSQFKYCLKMPSSVMIDFPFFLSALPSWTVVVLRGFTLTEDSFCFVSPFPLQAWGYWWFKDLLSSRLSFFFHYVGGSRALFWGNNFFRQAHPTVFPCFPFSVYVLLYTIQATN